ncbi:MAG TPA: HEAT repeat domain-containing protein [Acidobacteriota bacterium]|nr:HEAT repeat domain-containing protein [Acidobacteriota bacterium]
MYRGQDIGNRDKLIGRCLQAIGEKRSEALAQLLPHIAVIRAGELRDPLLQLLETGSLRQKEVAAIALGSLGDPSVISPLCAALDSVESRRGRGYEAFMAAVIMALGEIGHGDAVPVLLQLYRSDQDRYLQVQRRHLVMLSLGTLALHGSKRAEDELTALLESGDDHERISALHELAGSYWSRPNEVPDPIIDQLAQLADQSEDEDVSQAALAALRSLAEIGCTKAEAYFRTQSV